MGRKSKNKKSPKPRIQEGTEEGTQLSSRKEEGWGQSFTPAVDLQGEGLINSREGCLLPLGRLMKILHSFQFDPGVELPGHGIQINSCSVYLVDIKKEKPFFNSTVDQQAQVKTNCNQASDIIGKSDCKSVECESPVPSKGLGHVSRVHQGSPGDLGWRQGRRNQHCRQWALQVKVPVIGKIPKDRNGRFKY